MRYIKIPCDGTAAILEFNTTAESHDFKYFAREIDSDFVEQVRVGDQKSRQRFPFVMLVDDCGRLRGKDYNSRASYLYGIQIHGQPIVGDAILIGTTFDPMEGEDWADLPEHVTFESIAQYVLHDDASGLLG